MLRYFILWAQQIRCKTKKPGDCAGDKISEDDIIRLEDDYNR